MLPDNHEGKTRTLHFSHQRRFKTMHDLPCLNRQLVPGTDQTSHLSIHTMLTISTHVTIIANTRLLRQTQILIFKDTNTSKGFDQELLPDKTPHTFRKREKRTYQRVLKQRWIIRKYPRHHYILRLVDMKRLLQKMIWLCRKPMKTYR